MKQNQPLAEQFYYLARPERSVDTSPNVPDVLAKTAAEQETHQGIPMTVSISSPISISLASTGLIVTETRLKMYICVSLLYRKCPLVAKRAVRRRWNSDHHLVLIQRTCSGCDKTFKIRPLFSLYRVIRAVLARSDHMTQDVAFWV